MSSCVVAAVVLGVLGCIEVWMHGVKALGGHLGYPLFLSSRDGRVPCLLNLGAI